MTTINDLPLDVLDLLLNGDEHGLPALDARYRPTARLVSSRWRLVIETAGHGAKKALVAAAPADADAVRWRHGRVICASTLVDRLVHARGAGDIDAIVSAFLDAWAPTVSWLHATSVLALLGPPPPYTTARALRALSFPLEEDVDREIWGHALDRLCRRACAVDEPTACAATLSWQCIFQDGVLAAVDADCSEATVALLYRAGEALAADSTLPHDTVGFFEEHIGRPLWDHVVARDATRTATALLDLVCSLEYAVSRYCNSPADVWRIVLCAIGWTCLRDDWVVAGVHLGGRFTATAKTAAYYANVGLLRSLPKPTGPNRGFPEYACRDTGLAAGILDGPSPRRAAAVALDWLATERAFEPTDDQAAHIFATRPWLSRGRRRLSLLLDQWPHLIKVAQRHGQHMVASVLDALAADDTVEAEHLIEILDPYVPDPDEGLWPTVLARLHDRGYCQTKDLRAACALAEWRDRSPLWWAWCGHMTQPVDKRAVLACASRIGPGALDVCAKEALDGLFARLSACGLLIGECIVEAQRPPPEYNCASP
ncbi:hypothetical protein pdul_cds_690 [Pandoravirus dulcis]|uniref:F-box incomplete domain containing protein n=1 Tax=Pandoravirus dulcis TaxID=1349409 RepID=S4VXP7_9VIRU|nr:hypothetical protein pdul_cds_690 [Pandoravirus dulcis]AGO82841.1 hypothetical protein pdul_cds_690 [Pandoravirus dulcis]